MDLISKIEALFLRRGGQRYCGERDEPVSALAHALQCAQLAEWADADHHLVVAALLHDLGQLMDAAPGEALRDDQHELRALPLLASGFGLTVLEPIRLHVQARRYLLSADARHAQDLTPASPMSGEEKLLFMTRPFAREALQLRRWDELARQPGKRTPPLAYYLGMMQELLRAQRTNKRLAIA
ncbi:HD domain-containing protein [Paucibacter soli]|uniref:HD domain-containing protein n=1 Tax=Paucibacter soli TaxID=3133433 RepID=UPI0030ACFA42